MTGAVPNTGWLNGCAALDDKGFVKTGPDLSADDLTIFGWPPKRQPALLETSRPGLFAVGDVRARNVKRVASAVGEGSIAVSFIHKVLQRSWAMTLKIETRRSGDSLIVQLIGELAVEHLDEVKAQVNDAACPVIVDIGELALISVEGIRFLNACQNNGTPIINASGYITEWMTLEGQSELKRPW